MKRVLAGLTLGLTMCSASLAAPPTKKDVIVEPAWVARPSNDDIANAYPRLAMQLGIGGIAVMSCDVQELGSLQNCVTVSEEPEGMGFGDAVRSMARAFQMRPQTRNGEPVAGGVVRIPIRFIVPELAPLPQTPEPTSPQALEVARRLAPVLGDANATINAIEVSSRNIEYIPSRSLSNGARQAVAEALRGSYPGELPLLEEALARTYASNFSVEELSSLLAFKQSAAGVYVIGRNKDVEAVLDTVGKEARRLGTQTAQETFCATTTCSDDADRLALIRDADGPKPSVMIANPSWAQTPTLVEVRRVMPLLAGVMRKGGSARLTCVVGQLGTLRDCKIVGQTPPGLGFGQAALALASRYRLSPDLLGKGAEGETVAVITEFPMAPLGERDAEAFTVEPRSEASLKLALDLVDAGDDPIAPLQPWRMAPRDRNDVPGVTRAERDHAYDALRVGSDAANAYMRLQRAAWLTRRLTDSELLAGIRFWRTPAGKAWKAKTPELSPKITEVVRAYGARMWFDAGVAFCQQWKCPPGATTRLSGDHPQSVERLAPSTATP